MNIGLTIFNDIYTRFLDKVNRITRNTNITCSIDIGKITTSNIYNCNIVLLNKCISNELTTFSLLLESLGEVMLLLPEAQRNVLENRLGVTTDEIISEEDKGFIQNCRAEASVDNSINIGTIQINNCSSNLPTDFLFSNVGSVESNCGLKTLSDILLENNDGSNNIYGLKYLFNLSLFDYLLIVTIIILSYLLFIFITLIINTNKKKSIYITRNTILEKKDKILENIYIRRNNKYKTHIEK